MPYYFTKMKNIILSLLFALFADYASASQLGFESEAITKEIVRLEVQIKDLKTDNRALNDSIKKINERIAINVDSIASLNDQLKNLGNTLNDKNIELKKEIGSTNANLEETRESTQEDFRKYALFIAGILIITLLGFIFLFVFLRYRMKRGSATIAEIKNVQKKIQEESIKLDNKLISLIEKENIQAGSNGDHSLAMKVADEVVRIEMNLFRMDKSIKGYKQLSKAVERIKNNFTAQGYEIVDMLGSTYNEGMRINADFVVDESLAEGSRIITSITKPQINYMGQMIQKAIVTVSQNI